MITVIIPTSPIKSHPDTSFIEETIASVRHHLPDAEIIITFDGVREEQADYTDRYNEYKNKMLWKCLHQYENVLPIVFDEHKHQSGMIKEAINEVRTPLMLYVEHDTPLVTDRKIDWEELTSFITDGHAYTIRLHHESKILDVHQYLTIGYNGNFAKTYQWSQRPALSSVLYYKEVVLPNIPDNNFIEDQFYGKVANDYLENGEQGWFMHRLWIYHPKGNIQRSYHLDGRQGERKFTSDDEVWQ
jgi:hypothetical protein